MRLLSPSQPPWRGGRRRLLYAAAGTAGLIGLPAVAMQASPDAAWHEIVAPWLHQIRGAFSPLPISPDLARAADLARAQALRQALNLSPVARLARRLAVARLAALRQDEFTQGHVIRAGGWPTSLSEARAAALLARAATPAPLEDPGVWQGRPVLLRWLGSSAPRVSIRLTLESGMLRLPDGTPLDMRVAGVQAAALLGPPVFGRGDPFVTFGG